MSRTNEGSGLLIEDSTGQQMEVVLHRIHNHCVACVVAPLHKTHRQRSIKGSFLQHPIQITEADSYITPQPAALEMVNLFPSCEIVTMLKNHI